MTNTSTILDQLKVSTRSQHEALEEVARSEKLGSGQLSAKEYAALIKANYWAHRYLESTLERNFNVVSLLPDWPKRKKASLLLKELEQLGLTAEELDDAVPQKNRPDLKYEAHLWGVLYVMEGSTLGGAVISKALKKNEQLANYMPPQFYGAYAEETGVMWKNFRNQLAGHINSEEDEQEAIQAAKETFDFYSECFKQAFLQM